MPRGSLALLGLALLLGTASAVTPSVTQLATTKTETKVQTHAAKISAVRDIHAAKVGARSLAGLPSSRSAGLLASCPLACLAASCLLSKKPPRSPSPPPSGVGRPRCDAAPPRRRHRRRLCR